MIRAAASFPSICANAPKHPSNTLMYTLPEALAPLAAYRQFVLVRIAPKFDEAGNVVSGKTQKYSAWPHVTPTTAISAKTKQPYTVCQGDSFDAHDPTGWLSYDEARTLAAQMPIKGDTISWCIGFVLTAADPVVCLDLDDCLTLQGGWNDNASSMRQRFPGAYEVSLSGRGLHGWGFYNGVAPPHGKRNRHHHMELYTEKRFIALGHGASGTMYDLTTHLPAFIAEFFPEIGDSKGAIDDWSEGPVPEYTPLTDDELLRRAMSRTRVQEPSNIFGEGVFLPSFSDLWTRDVAAMIGAFPPESPGKPFGESDADFALAKELSYWTGKDCARIDRLMRSSALLRDKWDEGRGRHGTYLELTIKRAVAATTQVFHVKPIVLPAVMTAAAPIGKLAPRLIETPPFIVREALVGMFNDCVYIQDPNAVLLPNGDIVDQSRFNAKYAGYSFGMDKAGEKFTKSAWEAFLSNYFVHFPRVEGTEFNPRLDYQEVVERAGRRWVNVYKPPTVDRRPGDVGPFKELLNKLLPNGDDALILLSYMAAVVQYPGVKFRWAPFIQGAMGNGKSTIIGCLKHALGHKYIYPIKVGQIENGFNAWLENNVLYIADDIYSSKDRTDMMEALKSLITERQQSITYKGIDSISKNIVGNFIFTDNHKDAMKKQDGTRRICTLYCAQQTPHDRRRDGLTKEYFVQKLIPWLEGGGYAYVAEMLHTMEIDPRYNPAGDCQEAPETTMTQQAIEDGRTAMEGEVWEMIELEQPGFAGNFVSFHMLKKRFEGQRYPITQGKANEMMERLGYDLHPHLPRGRLPQYVREPDDTKPVLYVKRDSMQANQTDPAMIGALYVAAQNAAQTIQTSRKLGGYDVHS